MTELFFISDTHFNHAAILSFVGADGKLIRPEFSSMEEMDETMIENWNSVVTKSSHVYHLGDVVMGKGWDEAMYRILPRLNGKKRLILGNHDTYEKIPHLLRHFEKVMESRVMDSILFTHRPIRLLTPEFRTLANVHGHIHEKNIDEDVRYLNVSCERINYTPVHLDEIHAELRLRGVAVV